MAKLQNQPTGSAPKKAGPVGPENDPKNEAPEAPVGGEGEADGEGPENGSATALEAENGDEKALETAPKAPPVQAGFAQRAGLKSTAPVKPPPVERPYLDSPRDFGIYVEGYLVRFKKGRTSINDETHANLSGERLLKAIKEDAYVFDNGAELIEDPVETSE